MEQTNKIQVPDAPWMHQAEINLITAFLDPSFDMLEWGCGGSTILFSQCVNQYDSIEHNQEWYEQVTEAVKDRGLTNVNTYYVPTEDGGPSHPSTEERYHSYIHYPSILNKKYDRILIDGRARQFCAKYCTQYLKPDGLVFFHDFWMPERGRYREIALQYFNEVASIVHSAQTLVVLQPKQYVQ